MSNSINGEQSNSIMPLGACILLQLTMGMLYGWSVLLAPLESELSSSRSEVSIAYSLAFIFVTVGCFVTHRLLHWLALPKLTIVIMTLGAVGIGIAGFGENIFTLILGYGIIFGFASGVSYFLSVSACSIRSPLPHSVSLSIAVGSFALGGVVWPSIYTTMINWMGVFPTLQVSAIIIIISGIIAYYLFLYSNAEVPKPDNNTGFFEDLLTSKPRVMICLWLGFLLLAFAALMIIGHAAGMVKEWADKDITLGPMLPNLGYIAGALLAGQICRFLSGRLVTVGMCALAAITLILAWIFPGLTLGLIMLGAVGISFGIASTAYPSTIGNYYGINEIPRIYGRQSISYGLGGLLGPLAAAAIFDGTLSYSISILTAALIASAAALVHLYLPRNQVTT
ncbi:MAG: hypothetical protein CMM30_04225 [Rhodospirillaceae bacterium]|nr:hypothetical protein [Rhodospirillaceae bacterium]|tara:strand:- start:3461 stop:4645 length:1185 start_codon:yes stop_codon:yes gene_type:complete